MSYGLFYFPKSTISEAKMKKHTEEISFKDLLSVFISKLWLIIVIAVFSGTAMGVGTALLVDDTYTAKARLYSYIDKGSANINDITVAQQQIKTYEQLFKSKNFLNFVIAELSAEDRETIAPIISTVSIKLQQKDSTEAFDISITTKDPYVSYKVADAVARVSEAKIPELIPNASEVIIWDYPELPTSPNAKNTTRNAAIGFLGGAALTMIAIFIYNVFDVIIRDRKKLEDSFDIPILSVIPMHEIPGGSNHKTARKEGYTHDSIAIDKKRRLDESTPFAISEAFKSLYTSILYIPSATKCKKFAITSAVSGEGKTYVSTNLAITAAQSNPDGKVLLIDSDMRKPRVSALFEEISKKSHGLSEYLAGIDANPNIQSTSTPNLFVMTSGASSANATALLSSSRFATLLEMVENEYSLIIFDTPPINIVSDAILLNDYIDGYLLSAKTDYSSVNEIDETINKIAMIDGKVVGFSLTAIPLRGYTSRGRRRYSGYHYYQQEDRSS